MVENKVKTQPQDFCTVLWKSQARTEQGCNGLDLALILSDRDACSKSELQLSLISSLNQQPSSLPSYNYLFFFLNLEHLSLTGNTKPPCLEQLPSKKMLGQQQQPVKANSGMPLGTVTREEEKKDVFNLPGNDQYRIKSDLEF